MLVYKTNSFITKACKSFIRPTLGGLATIRWHIAVNVYITEFEKTWLLCTIINIIPILSIITQEGKLILT